MQWEDSAPLTQSQYVKTKQIEVAPPLAGSVYYYNNKLNGKGLTVPISKLKKDSASQVDPQTPPPALLARSRHVAAKPQVDSTTLGL